MSMAMTAAPAVEPVTLAEAKAQLRVDGNAEDAYITSLIVTSRLQIEAALGLALITQRWRLTLDDWPGAGVVELPMRPVQSIESIAISHGDGAASLLPGASYHLDGMAQPARLVLKDEAPPRPNAIAEGIAIDFTAGFGLLAVSVPQPIRQALLLLVAHWFENREPSDANNGTRIPDAVSALLAPYRVVHL